MTLCTALSPHNMVRCDLSEHPTTHDIHTRHAHRLHCRDVQPPGSQVSGQEVAHLIVLEAPQGFQPLKAHRHTYTQGSHEHIPRHETPVILTHTCTHAHTHTHTHTLHTSHIEQTCMQNAHTQMHNKHACTCTHTLLFH